MAATVAARTKKLKFGTSVLALPLWNPTVLAKEIATLDFLSGGRMLPDGLPPIWIGGRSEAAMRRTARIGDGWPVSQATPEEVKVGVKKIKAWAAAYGRDIEADHCGTLLSFCFADSRAKAEKLAAPYMLHRRPDVDYRTFSAFGGPEDFVELMQRYVDAGAAKCVARPACPPELMQEQLAILGCEIIARYQGTHDVSSRL